MSLNLNIQRNKGVSLRYQLRVQLEEMILNRELTGCFPAEEDISSSLNISRGTVRAALDDLFNEGLLYRIQGKGTYVQENNFSLGKIIIYMNSEVTNLSSREDEDNYNSSIIENLLHTLHREGFSAIFRRMPDRLTPINSHPASKTGVLAANPRKHSAEFLKSLEAFSSPSVVLGSNVSEYNLDFVALDNNLGVRKGLDLLINMGHKKIAHIGVMNSSYDSSERFESFKKITSEKNIYDSSYHVMIDTSDLLKAETFKIFKAWEKQGFPTAIITGGLPVSMVVMEAAEKMNLRIPGDISLVGFDDFKISGYLNPPLTSIKQPIPEMVDTAVGILKKKMDAPFGAKRKNRRVLMPPELMLRESCMPEERGGGRRNEKIRKPVLQKSS